MVAETTIELTAIQKAETKQKIRESENVRLDHAIEFLDNHVAQFGEYAYGYPKADDSYTEAPDQPSMIKETPQEIRQAMEQALIAAARFVEQCFLLELKTGDDYKSSSTRIH